MFTDLDVDYVPVGCYRDEMSNRALPELLENYRVETRKYPDVLEWEDLERSVIERCALKVSFVVGFVSYVETDHNELLQSVVAHNSQKGYYFTDFFVTLFVRWTLDQVVRVRTLAGGIVLCPWARHFTFTVPLLSTGEFNAGTNHLMEYHPIFLLPRGSRNISKNISSRYMLQKTG